MKAQIVLNLVERILNPARLRDVTAERLSYFAAELRKAYKVGDKLRPCRSETTIAGYLAHLRAAMSWVRRPGAYSEATEVPRD